MTEEKSAEEFKDYIFKELGSLDLTTLSYQAFRVIIQELACQFFDDLPTATVRKLAETTLEIFGGDLEQHLKKQEFN